MACIYTIGGKTYDKDGFMAYLLNMNPAEASKYMPGVTSVPDMPFKKNWQEVVLKRIIRMAAEQGIDKVSWVTGQQTADRYDLSKHLDRIEYEKTDIKDDPDVEGEYELVAYNKEGKEVMREEEIDLERIEKLVGKGIAQKIKDGKGSEMEDSPYRDWRILSGLDLKVGGEWAFALYDKMIPQYLKKFGKKYGAEVGSTEINGQEQKSFTITPELKKTALYEGMSLFSKSKSVPSGQGISRASLDFTVKAITAKWKNIADIKVVDSVDQIPQEIMNRSNADPSTLRVGGVYTTDGQGNRTVYLVRENLLNPKDVRLTLLEETLGHDGLRQALGTVLNPKTGKSRLESLLDRVWLQEAEGVQALADDYRIDTKTHQGRQEAADEWISKQIAADTLPQQIWSRLVSIIRQWARQVMPNLNINITEAKSLARQAIVAGRGLNVAKAATTPDIRYQKEAWHGQTTPGEPITEFDPDTRFSAKPAAEDLDQWAARQLKTIRDQVEKEAKKEDVPGKIKKPKLKESALEAIEFEQSPMRTARATLTRHFNDTMYWIVDKNRPITTVQNLLDNVTDDVDVFLKETQRPKRTAAKIKNAWADEVKPLIERMSEYKVNVPDLEVYKHALHAQEANEALRRSNAKLQVEKIIKILESNKEKAKVSAIKKDIKELKSPDEWYMALNNIIKQYGTEESLGNTLTKWKAFAEKPSGMTDSEASEILTQHKGNKKIEELGKMLDSINDKSLALLFNSGALAEEEYTAILNKYEHYVPLYREGFDDRLFGATKGLRPSGRPIKVRGGSTRNVINIVAHSIANYEKAINRAEKARSQRALKGLIEANPESDVINIEPVKKSKRYDPLGNLRMYPDWNDVQKNEMRLMVEGEQYLVSVQRDNKDGMLMMRTLKAEDGMTGPVVNTFAKLNRFLAKINTTWSPEFIISNFARDIQTAGINIQDTGVKGKGMLKGAKDAWGAIFAIERGKPKGTELESYYERFKAAGGKIGWSDVHGSVDSLGKKITNELKMMNGEAPVRERVKDWLQLIEDINTSIENGIRLHAFKLAVDQGKTDERAAQIASDLTVDFTKKGAAGPVINSFYLFANAGIQGSYRIIRAGTKSSSVRKTMAGIVGVGFAVGVLNALAGGEDEDGEDYFNKIDDYIRERNMIIMLPGTEGKYVKIPLPWGYNVFWNMGTEASRAFTKENYSYLSGAGRLASTFANAFNPVASGTLLQTLLPTVADPFVQVAENKNWFGGDLMPERNKFDKTPDPDSQRYWKSAGVASKWVASQLNSITGGDKVKPGLIDISPETLDLVVDTVGGSAFRFVKDTLSLPINVSREEIGIPKIPFVRRVAGEKPAWADSRVYYENIEDVLVAKERLKVYRGTANYDKLAKALRAEKSLIPLASKSEKDLRSLRKWLKRAKVQGDKGRIERINERIKRVYVKFNKRYNETMGKL